MKKLLVLLAIWGLAAVCVAKITYHWPYQSYQLPSDWQSKENAPAETAVKVVELLQHNDFSKAMQKSQDEKKPIIVYFTADW